MISLSKTTQNIHYQVFFTISGSKITTDHFCMSCVIVSHLKSRFNISSSSPSSLIIPSAAAVSSIALSLQLALSLLLSLKFCLNCTQFPALQWVSELPLPLLCTRYHPWVNTWTKRTDWKHAGRTPDVQSYTQWKAEFFSAYQQKELTHMCWLSVQQQEWIPHSARVLTRKIFQY